jgi:hypothetical protein
MAFTMTTREFITTSCPHATGFLDQDLDGALLGWVERYDLKPRVAYALEKLVLLVGDRWTEDQLVNWLHEQCTIAEPESVVVEQPAPKHTFWQQVKDGLLIWDQLTPAICGIARLRGNLCCVYHRERAIQDLADSLACSDDKDPAVQMFFDKDIAGAKLGECTPLILYSDKDAGNNRLGFGPPSAQPAEPPDEIST